MKNDLKKKFLDILFEPEDPEVIEDDEITEIKKTTPVKEAKPQVKETKTVKASELLYGQNETKSFNIIDSYVEKEKPEKVQPEVKEEKIETYELKPHISPIFGNIEGKKVAKEEVVKKPSVSQSAINPKEYTGIVLSPIFGYDSNSAEKARVDFMKNKKKDSALLTKTYENKEVVKEVKFHEETISLFDEPFDEPQIKEEVFDEPFTSEIKVIDIEGEPIEEVKEEYDDEPQEIKSFELEDLDVLDDYKFEELDDEEDEVKEDKKVDMETIMSSNAKSFIDDLLGDKD